MKQSGVFLRVAFFLSFIACSFQVKADEGMWLLSMLKKYNADELYKMGLKIPVERISGGNAALSEAVVSFGGGCSGSVISDQGLIVTNYHCSYGAIQQHTSVKNDIAGKGFWASDFRQELPVSGLKITVTKKIIDISDEAKTQPLATVTKKYQQQYPGCKIITRSYRNNSIVVLYVQVDYTDVRLVGLAPKNIAKFGGETDNWMWPRHSADFAFFRVYTNAAGQPAAYSASNVPLKAANFLKVSTAGYRQGDFAMSMGFPGMSDRYSTSYKIADKVTTINPPLIAVRKLKLAILEEEMAKNDTIRIAYAEKYSTAANYYKNAVGMNFWINKLDIVAKKKKYEFDWLEKLSQKGDTAFSLQRSFADLDKISQESITLKKAGNYYLESFSETCDMIRFVSVFSRGFENFDEELRKNPSHRRNFLSNTRMYYSQYNSAVDKKITKAVLLLLKDSLPQHLLPEIFEQKKLYSANDIDKYVDDVYEKSVFSDSIRVKKWLTNPSGNIAEDPAILLTESITKKQAEIAQANRSEDAVRGRVFNDYRKSVDRYGSGRFYPDADKTMRLSYGSVSDLSVDNVVVPFQTTLGELIKKSNFSNKDYFLNPLLKTMWEKKDFASYASGNDIPACFITNGDVTGGNSGSPMMNANGELIGLVFDCNWESMTREFHFDQSLHRVICVDIRYVLYLTEQLSGNKKLFNEITRS